MKQAIIVHCWDGYPEYCWYPWAKTELEKLGISVIIPLFPETELPKLAAWLPKLQEIAGEPNQDTYLIGHSIGCATIMRYLESLPEGQKIGGVVFVAGFTENVGFDEIANFFQTPLDLQKVKTKANKFIAIHSDDDPYVDLKYGDIFKEKLGAELIVKHNMKHFSGEVDNEESCIELPEVVESIKKMIQ